MNAFSPEPAPAPPNAIPADVAAFHPPGRGCRWTALCVCILLAVLVWFVFGPTAHYQFINYDDDAYVYNNPVVTAGLKLTSVVSAFHPGGPGKWDWVPLSTITHMSDCQLFGLNAGGHHLTNALLHSVAAILLFLLLREMTGAIWRSAFVAMVFAIHPLRVESVAWVTERKDVLSGVFFMLTLWAYVRYVRNPASFARYLLVVVFFALGLMSKSMIVTLPFVLLLLDYWPLNRFAPLSPGTGAEPVPWLRNLPIPVRLVVEKIPLLALSAAACVLAVLALGHSVQSLETFSLPMRIGNALVSYVVYIGQMFYPLNLAVFYPYPPGGWPVGMIVSSVLLLAGISLGIFLGRRRYPYLLIGWLWYLGMLVPVIGLFEAGDQAHADRFTYLPQIGLYILLTWMTADVSIGGRRRVPILAGAAIIIIVALMVCARSQVSYWKDSETLFSHALAVTKGNETAHLNLGFALEKTGHKAEAMAEYRAALALNPDRAETHNDIANLLYEAGHLDEALAEYQEAIRVNPDHAPAHVNLGKLLVELGRFEEAMKQYAAAGRLDPADWHPPYLTGQALLEEGRDREAISCFRDAVQRDPNEPRVLAYLAQVLASDENSQARDGRAALAMAAKANDLTSGAQPPVLDTLAMAYAEIGQFQQAQQTAAYALKLATAYNRTNDVVLIGQRLQLYQANRPFRQSFLRTNAPAAKWNDQPVR